MPFRIGRSFRCLANAGGLKEALGSVTNAGRVGGRGDFEGGRGGRSRDCSAHSGAYGDGRGRGRQAT